MMLAAPVGAAHYGVALPVSLNCVHATTIKIWNVAVGARTVLNLANNRIQRTNYGPARPVEILTRRPERQLNLDMSQIAGVCAIIEMTAVEPAVMCSTVWHDLSYKRAAHLECGHRGIRCNRLIMPHNQSHCSMS
jgi:hypothetical protein